MTENTGSSALNSITDISKTSTDQTTQDMEVHHHGHVHEKTKWKEYVFQFFMLLLAVFLGSLAETKREEWVEGHKEKNYMESMVEDIKKDTAQINRSYSFAFDQLQNMDSLQQLLSKNVNMTQDEIFESYKLSNYLFWYATVVFDERTYSQLIGSGNMRIIKGNGAADSIMGYYNSIKTIDQQRQQYISYINVTLSGVFKIFDVLYLKQKLNSEDSLLHLANMDWSKLHFRTKDPAMFIDLSSTIETTKRVIYNYILQLSFIRQNADRLILFLKEEYNIKEDKKE